MSDSVSFIAALSIVSLFGKKRCKINQTPYLVRPIFGDLADHDAASTMTHQDRRLIIRIQQCPYSLDIARQGDILGGCLVAAMARKLRRNRRVAGFLE
jgi:hypothetical protein